MSRHFVFTTNNYTEDELAGILGLPDAMPEIVRFVAMQEEIGPETGTPHLQGYLVMQKSVRVSAVMKLLPGYVEKKSKFSTIQENLNYVSEFDKRKPDTDAYSNGQPPPGQGFRTDVEGLAMAINSGKDLTQIWNEMPGSVLHMPRATLLGLRIHAQKSNSEMRQISTRLFWGPTQTGKTHVARREAMALDLGPVFVYTKNSDASRALGYFGERVIILDEFLPDWFGLSTLLRILDGLPHAITTFGDHCYAKWTEIWITSNLAPEDWYPEAHPASIQALFSRLHHIERFHQRVPAALRSHSYWRGDRPVRSGLLGENPW